MRTGTVGASAICAARYRLAPATISKLWSVRGRTSKGDRTPWLRILSANSLRAESSKMRRGLVADSVRTASGRLRYSVAVFVFMDCSPLSGWNVRGVERTARGRPRLESLGLAGLRQFRLLLFGSLCCGVFDCRENEGGSFLDHFQALREQ